MRWRARSRVGELAGDEFGTEGLRELEASQGAGKCGRKKDAMGMKLMKDEGLRTADGARDSGAPTLFGKGAKRMGHGSQLIRQLNSSEFSHRFARNTANGWGTGCHCLLAGSLMSMGRAVAVWLLAMGLAATAWAQGVSTTTVAGTVYLANGQPGAGTLVISWPAFTTAAGQAVVADSTTVTIPADGFVSVNLAPNAGATPAGEYYTAVYYMSDGTVSTQYWVVPAAAQATLAQVQAQVMPAAQAVQTVSKAYVDQAITELTQSLLTASGGTLSGPLIFECRSDAAAAGGDQALRGYAGGDGAAAGRRDGDAERSPPSRSARAYQVDQFAGADFGAKVQACLSALNASYGGTCDARNFTGNLSMASNLTISTANAAVLLPCATITTANQIVVTAGTRNVSLRGCALRGGSAGERQPGRNGVCVFGHGRDGRRWAIRRMPWIRRASTWTTW